jgi:hypothetical protein
MKFGRHPARVDLRVPRYALVSHMFPPPPDQVNWGAAVDEWYMLANDRAGDCVIAAAMHFVWQQLRYKPPYRGPAPTDEEAIANYSAIGGYVPGNDSTDNGLYVQGPGGLMPYWLTTGLRCCGQINKIESYVAIDPHNTTHLRQAINVCGGVLTGINFPVNLMNLPELPFVWDDVTGPRAGHEIILTGYRVIGGARQYDLISWGKPYRIWERDLLKIIDETTAVLDPVSMDERGTTPAGYDHATMVAMLDEVRAVA